MDDVNQSINRRGIHAAGGNLLLNVPPDRTGRIPEYHVKALMELKEAIK
jgi:alpha-L-fucosidase